MELQKKLFIVTKLIIAEKKMRDYEVAQKMGITTGMFSKLKNGTSRMDLDQVEALAKALDIPLYDLLKLVQTYDEIGGYVGFLKRNTYNETIK